MKVLILGGTVFLGKHLVEEALRRDYEVTLFNRGRHNPDLFSEVEKLRGDRDGGLDSLRRRSWDVCIDTSGYVPRVVRQSAFLLADNVQHYTFVSTVSVYADLKQAPITEAVPVATLKAPTVEVVDGETYGGLKALCEQVVEEIFEDRAFINRPGLIVGPDDPTDRFTWWPVRIRRGGETLAPGSPEEPVQFIDARDLAAWILDMAAARRPGIFNATGPNYQLSMRNLFETCKEIGESTARFTWIPDSFLLENHVEPWTELPLWIPATPDMAGFSRVDCTRAIDAGLRFRPLEETIQDTLQWAAARGKDYQWKCGLSEEKEENILDAWSRRR